MITPPERVDVDDASYLRHFREHDAGAIARAVRESLDHLRPWMPWANAQSGDPTFQRERLKKLPELAARGEEWQYGLFGADDALLGSFGLMTRRGPGTLEIGYWVHVDATGQGHATRAAGALAHVALTFDEVRVVLICCDEANVASAAIPKRLGFRLVSVDPRQPEAPGERGRLMTWELRRD
ncbi:MAG TPA: GNAT family N-acetyltransferase [Acidimicrobiia bacterium]|nr:GNAT family N-acetyltransferase [Acidimicrobiia bacterium]